MKVSQFWENSEAVRVVRDVDFDTLGYVTHRINKRRLLVYAGNEKFLRLALQNPFVVSVIVNDRLVGMVPDHIGCIVSTRPEYDFFDLNHKIIGARGYSGPEFKTKVGRNCQISAHAVIPEKNVSIGDGTVIHAGVIVHENTYIGRNCVIRSNTVVGSDGFEYKRFDSNLKYITHGGGVFIDNEVQIHSNCTIDQGLFGEPTRIGRNTCIDNLVHVAHGVDIGAGCIIAAGVVFAAAVVVGDASRIDPNSTIAHEVVLGERCYVTMGSVVASDVPAGAKVSGNFAVEHRKFVREHVRVRSGR